MQIKETPAVLTINLQFDCLTIKIHANLQDLFGKNTKFDRHKPHDHQTVVVFDLSILFSSIFQRNIY